MKFQTEFERLPTIPMPVTSKYEKQYEEIVNKAGKVELKEKEPINVYEKIQAACDGVLLSSLIEKHKIKINDYDMTKINDTIIDLTNMPTSLTETMNVIDRARVVFESAPKDIRAFFNNNFSEFLAGADNGTLTSLINEKYNQSINKGQQTFETTPEHLEQLSEVVEKQAAAQQQAMQQQAMQQPITNGGVNYGQL